MIPQNDERYIELTGCYATNVAMEDFFDHFDDDEWCFITDLFYIALFGTRPLWG